MFAAKSRPGPRAESDSRHSLSTSPDRGTPSSPPGHRYRAAPRSIASLPPQFGAADRVPRGFCPPYWRSPAVALIKARHARQHGQSRSVTYRGKCVRDPIRSVCGGRPVTVQQFERTMSCACMRTLRLPSVWWGLFFEQSDLCRLVTPNGSQRQSTGKPTASARCVYQRSVKGHEQSECVPRLKTIVLLYRDDLIPPPAYGAYDRFGCPFGHIQAAFRCFLLQNAADRTQAPATDKTQGAPDKTQDVTARAQACWINPTPEPVPPPSASVPSTTTNR